MTTPAPPTHASLLASALADLQNPTTVRNDIAFVAGLAATVAALVFHRSLPALPEAFLVGGGLILATVVRVVHTIAHAGISKAALASDLATVETAMPDVENAVKTIEDKPVTVAPAVAAPTVVVPAPVVTAPVITETPAPVVEAPVVATPVAEAPVAPTPPTA